MIIDEGFSGETGDAVYTVTAEIVPDGVTYGETADRYIVVICRDKTDIDPIVAGFDPASASSPSAADCRDIARPIVQAIADGGG